MHGGSGNDRVYGDDGVDFLCGETGADRFVFRSLSDAPISGLDRIMDFADGQDLIDLSLIDANATLAGNQAFSFAGAKPFFTSAVDLWVTSSLLGSVVQGEVNGVGISDFRILVGGDYDMGASNFVL